MMNWIKNLATKNRASHSTPYCDTELAIRDWNALLKGRSLSPKMPNFLHDISRGQEGAGAGSKNHEGCAPHSGQQFLS